MNTRPTLLFLQPASRMLAVLLIGSAAMAMTNEETAAALMLRKFVLPDYPGILRLQGVPDGEALVAMSRDADGLPRDVLILDTTKPEFATAALEAVREWRFLPASAVGEVINTERPRLVRFLFKAGGVVVVASVAPARKKAGVAMPSDYKPVLFSDLDRIPKALRQPLPAFPPALAGKMKAGEASVAFFVDETGKVRVPVVTAATAPEFAQAALKTITMWAYEPPVRAGRPVVAYEALTIQFGPAPKP